MKFVSLNFLEESKLREVVEFILQDMLHDFLENFFVLTLVEGGKLCVPCTDNGCRPWLI